MAIKTYRATMKGQAPNGAIIEEGQTFSAEFTEVVREEPIKRDGKVIGAGKIVRDEEGRAKTRAAKTPPSWVEEVSEAKASKAKVDD